MNPLKNFLAASLILLAGFAYGQTLTTQFLPAMSELHIGQTVALQLQVSNFTHLESLQFPITYNHSVLTFDSIDNPILPGYADTTVVSHPVAGKVTITWFCNVVNFPQGVSLIDHAALMTIKFTVVGAGSANVNIDPAVFPGVEILDSNDQPVSLNYQSGGANITGIGNPVICSGSSNPPAAPVYSGFKVMTNSIYIPQGEIGCMPVTVNGFNNVLTLLFALHWDPASFEFDCLRGFNLPMISNNINKTTPNTILVGWDDPSAAGVTRSDGSKIFEVCFRAVAPPSSSSIITINGFGFPPGVTSNPEAYNLSSQNLWTNNSAIQDTIFVTNPNAPQCPVIFSADKDSVDAGTQTCVDIKAENFYWMNNAEFTLHYDPSLASFKQIQLGANPLNLKTTGVQSNFNFTKGALSFSWKNNIALNGVTLNDQTTLFSVCFQTVETPGVSADISFGSAHCLAIGAARKNIGGVPLLTKNGAIVTRNSPFIIATDTVIIVYGNRMGHKTTTGAGNIDMDGQVADLQASIYPNPFAESATIEFTLAQSEDVDILIIDPIGRIVYKKSAELLPPGKHGMKIDKDMLPEKGIYYLTIRTTTQNAVQTFFKF